MRKALRHLDAELECVAVQGDGSIDRRVSVQSATGRTTCHDQLVSRGREES